MIRELLSCVKEYKKDSILTPIFMIGEVVMEIFIPLVIAKLIDLGVDAGNMDNILKYGIILVICALLSLMFGVLSGKHAAIASAGFAKNVRTRMFYNVQSFSFKNIDKFSTASLVTRLTTDVTNLQHAYQMIIRIAVRSPSIFIFALIMSLSINPKLSSIFVFVLPVLIIGLVIIIKTAFPVFQSVFKEYDHLNSVVQENLYGIRVVKAYVREEHEKQKFKGVSNTIFTLFSKAEKTLAYNGPLMQLCLYTCMLLISWFGARLIVSSELSTGQLMSLISYATQILMSLMMLSMVFVMIVISRASAERVVEVLKEKSDITDPESPRDTVPDGSIDFENVSFSYTNDMSKLCLKNIDLHIRSGETIGIIGGTGSGKSSLVQLIPRLYDPTSGTVKIGGHDAKEYSLEALRGSVSVVLQKNVLFSGTINENLRWGNKSATDEEIRHACELACADEFINEFPDGYNTHIEQGGTNVSGGQKQRLCIARALLKHPKVLILDDSTSAVDTATDAKIRSAFRSEIPNTTKLIIAQRIASVQDADRIIVLEGGEVAGIGTHDELLKSNAIYREVYESQQKGANE